VEVEVILNALIFAVCGAQSRAQIGKLPSLLAVVLSVTLVLFGCEPVINKMAFHPDDKNVIPVNRLPHGVQEIFIETEDKISLQSYFIHSKHSDKVIIYFHGNAGNIGHRLPDLLKLSSFGLNVLGVSYRGYGKSQGKPSEAGIYMDGDAALNHAILELGFPAENVFIQGRSIGTCVAIHVSRKKEIGGLILVAPLTSGADQAKASGLGLISFMAGDSFNNIGKIKDVLCPVLIIHGSKDNVIPIAMGATIFEKVRSKKKFVEIKGANHNNLSTKFSSAYWPPIMEFLNSFL
jgi:fermentation-respiration switch protein FrsA (DUF1100 family)